MVDDSALRNTDIKPISFLSLDTCGNNIMVTVKKPGIIHWNEVGKRFNYPLNPLKPCREVDTLTWQKELSKNG